MNKLFITTIILILAIGSFYLIKGGNNQPQETQTPQTTSQSPGQIKTINVTGTEFAYSPSSLDLQAGETVRLNFENAGNLPHDLVIEGTNIRTEIINRGTTSIEFTAPATGTYTYYCSVPGHREQGMFGDLTTQNN